MKSTIKITAISLLLFIAGTGISNGQYGRMARNMDRGQMSYCMNIPDLTDTQKEKITALAEEHRKEMDEMRKDRFDESDVYKRNEIAAKMILKRNEHLKSIESLLTDSQKEFFLANVAEGRQGPGGQRFAARQHGRNGFRGGQGFRQGRGFRGGQARGYRPDCPRF